MFLLACSSLQEECIPAGFLYKRGFQIRMKKGTQVRSLPAMYMHMSLYTSKDSVSASKFIF